MPSYLDVQEVRSMHVEASSFCNAACPQCDRNIYGAGINPNIVQAYLAFTDFQKFFPPEFCAKLELVTFSGVHGDPIFCPDFLEIANYLKTNGTKAISFHTNGSAKDEGWWRGLASALKDDCDWVHFGIDGLEDTHHLYRRGTDWNTVIRNMKTFIAAGGQAEWSFLVFKHNEHQVEKAEKMARELGCARFRYRRTHRFQSLGLRQLSAPFPVLKDSERKVDRDFIEDLYKKFGTKFNQSTDFAGELREFGFDYTLAEPEGEKYRNPVCDISVEKNILEQYGTFDSYFEHVPVDCTHRKWKRIYVDSHGKVWPCCFIGGDTKTWHYRHRFRDDYDRKVLRRFPANFNSLHHHPLSEILQNEWFGTELVQGWEDGVKSNSPFRLKRCGKTCGEKYRPNLAQNVVVPSSGSARLE